MPKPQLLRNVLFLLLVSLFSGTLSGCVSTFFNSESSDDSRKKMRIFDPKAVNSPEVLKKPYVVLVSIDGYRHDYNRLFEPPNLLEIEKEGVAAKSLRPVYPSKTFPNHYSIATGVYANRHGIVSNDFYDPKRQEVFVISNRAAVEDGSWYGAEPIWITAQKQGLLTASFFWVGSEANINGRHANYYYRFDDSIPKDVRVQQVLDWLQLPEERRPHLIMLYFGDVDRAGHKFGVHSQQNRAAVLSVDTAIGQLRKGLKELDLPINLIVLSDHGMLDLEQDKLILLDRQPQVAELLSKFRVHGKGPQIQLYLKSGENPNVIHQMEKALEKGAKNYRVHRRRELAALKYDSDPRVGDLVVEPSAPFIVGFSFDPPGVKGGNHGWDGIKSKEMHGIFYAEGPAFKKKFVLPSFENIHVNPLVMEVLGLKPVRGIDGKLTRTKAALKPL